MLCPKAIVAVLALCVLSEAAALPTPDTLATEVTCTGSDDPDVSSLPLAYAGSVKELGQEEDVSLTLDSYAAGKGVGDLTASGSVSKSCSKVPFTKTGQTLDVDLSACGGLPAGASLSTKYCSDQDKVVATIAKGLLKVDVELTRVTLSAEVTCTGSDDPDVSSLPLAYAGSVKELGQEEDVSLTLDSYAAGKGVGDLTASGSVSKSCSKVPFTKTGQTLDVDLSACGGLPAGASLSTKYCSDQDKVVATIAKGLLKVDVELTRVTLAAAIARVSAA